MSMKDNLRGTDPDAYVQGLDGSRRRAVQDPRAAVQAAGGIEERIKWGHIVGFHQGPVLLIRAEASRALFGFWRGKRLRDLAPWLKPGGKYELATLTLTEGDPVDIPATTRLVRAAIALNQELGDPTARA